MARRALYAVIPLVLLFVGAEILARVAQETALVQRERPDIVEGPHILCVGDSWTFGYGLDVDESWPGQLASVTGRQVLNLGEPGTSPLTAVGNVRDWPHRPDVVIALTGANPIPAQGAPAPLPAARSQATGLALFRVVEQLVVRASEPPPPPAEVVGLNRGHVTEALVRMRDIARGKGAEFIALTYPLPAGEDSALVEVNTWIRSVEARGVRVLDLQEVNANLGYDALLADEGYDRHPNALGYSRMAAAIAEELSPARTD